ncbi:MAG: hypothetical protein H0W44_00465 [Gammaproteobacteria bacterium]|nr:hypothetical protein [Gammaproteobacteria bacterium]
MSLLQNSIVVIAVLFTGCGFHLRGDIDLPPAWQPLEVQSESLPLATQRDLQRMLDQANVKVVEKDAAAQLRIISENIKKKVLSVDSFGRVYEYDLEYSLNYALTLRGEPAAAETGEELTADLPGGIIALSGSYRFDPLAVLAAQDEEQRVVSELRQKALQQMMRRMAKFKARQKNQPPDK